MASKGLYKGKTPKGFRPGGRKKGTPNRFTATVKEVFENVFLELQKDKSRTGPSLAQWARRNPGDYYKISSRLIPNQITGEGGGLVQVAATCTVYMPDNGRRTPVGGPGVAAEAKTTRKKLRIRRRSASP